MSAARIFPLVSTRGTAEFAAGGGPARIVAVRLDRAGTGRWRQTIGEIWIIDLVTAEDGALLIEREVDTNESARAEYDPALPLLPASLAIGRPVTHRCRIAVWELESGRLETRGKVEARYELLGRRSVATPAETFDAHVVRVTRQIDFPLATVTVTIHEAYAVGDGPVAQVTQRVMRLFGLLPAVMEQRLRRVPDGYNRQSAAHSGADD